MAGITDFVRNAKVGKLTLRDGTPTPVSLACYYDLGDFSLDELSADANEVVVPQRRGQRMPTIFGDRIFPTGSFSVFVTELSTEDAPGTPLDFVCRRGAYADNISIDGPGRPYLIEIEFETLGAPYGVENDVLVLHGVKPKIGFGEAMDGSKFSISFEVLDGFTLNGTPFMRQVEEE